MSECFVGEIRMFGGNFAPLEWAFCDGSTLRISEYEVLFSLIGTTYGGNGIDNFKLPDLRGHVPIHQGAGPGLTPRVLGASLGQESVTLGPVDVMIHSHGVRVGAAGTAATPAGNYPANSVGFNLYWAPGHDSVMSMDTVGMSTTNAAQPHSNLMPTQCINYIIALYGIYPTRD